jgi:hypothetical protein
VCVVDSIASYHLCCAVPCFDVIAKYKYAFLACNHSYICYVVSLFCNALFLSDLIVLVNCVLAGWGG